MKTFVALVALFAVALAAAPARRLLPAKPLVHQLSQRAAVAPVVRNVAVVQPHVAVVPRAIGSSGSDVVVVKETLHNNVGLDGYQYSYELSDGSARDEVAQVETRGVEDAVIRVRGSFRFIGQDGQTYTVNYVADENGYQPEGAHLPVAPQLH